MTNEVIKAAPTVESQAQSLNLLASQFGYEGTLTVGALEDEIRFYQQRTVEACMELGKRLLLLKEMTPHGEFNKRIEMLNFTPRMAQKFMSAVLKFSKTNSNSLLHKAGNQTKLLELVALDDDEIQVIEAGGSVGDLNLDSIETMSVRELKTALRAAHSENQQHKENDAAKDQLLLKKDQKLNELDAKLTKAESLPEIKKREESEPQIRSKQALEAVNLACLTMHNNTVRFVNDINSVYDMLSEHNIFDVQERITHSIVAAFQQIAETASELCVQVDFEEMVNPAWTTDQPNFDVASEMEQ
ncbi:DUF3102 domain-containing protein [Acinetobacter bereziniae]|uniref:DUF3102 domain-containing protein n=1 Tax=Acinetobacter bereziniae TaxID=106648 RepID=UPI0006686848|nr:DUF3102 domain-containing protein [Acinetobacter bereziniae]